MLSANDRATHAQSPAFLRDTDAPAHNRVEPGPACPGCPALLQWFVCSPWIAPGPGFPSGAALVPSGRAARARSPAASRRCPKCRRFHEIAPCFDCKTLALAQRCRAASAHYPIRAERAPCPSDHLAHDTVPALPPTMPSPAAHRVRCTPTHRRGKAPSHGRRCARCRAPAPWSARGALP